MGRGIALLVLVIAGLTAVLVASQWRAGPLRVSGFVEADEIRLGSRVGGRVMAVHVNEGERVQVGQVLVELEPFDRREWLAEAQADLSAKQAALALLQSGYRDEEIAQAAARVRQLEATLALLVAGPRSQEIEVARAELEQNRSRLSLAETTHRRVRESFDRKAATPAEMDEAEDNLRIARAGVTAAEQRLRELEEGTRAEEIERARAQLDEARAAHALLAAGFREEQVREAVAAVDAAMARVAAIEQQVAELKIVAPIDATVEALDLDPGDLVAPDAPVMSLMDTRDLWVRAYVPENRLNLRPGQPLAVTVDSFPDRTFRGHVTFISRQGEFTPSNIQTPEERSQQVFRIRVQLDEGHDVLRPGMAADVWLDAEGERG